MVDFKLLAIVINKKWDGLGLNFARPQLQVMLYHIAKLLAFELFILVFGTPPLYTNNLLLCYEDI